MSDANQLRLRQLGAVTALPRQWTVCTIRPTALLKLVEVLRHLNSMSKETLIAICPCLKIRSIDAVDIISSDTSIHFSVLSAYNSSVVWASGSHPFG